MKPNLSPRLLCLVLLPLLFVWGCSSGGRRGAYPEDRIYLHKVEAGETLSEIAEDYYGNPARGDFIGAFNDVEDATIRPGMVLRVPMTGEEIERLKTRGRARGPYNEGLELARNGAYLDAVRRFQESLSIDPDFVDALYNLGVTFQKMKSYDRALEQFAGVVRLRPDEAKYYFALGNCYFHLQRYGEAAKTFEKVVQRDRTHTKAQYSLAVSYEKLGQREKARDAWQRYLEIDSKSVWATEARKRLNRLK